MLKRCAANRKRLFQRCQTLVHIYTTLAFLALLGAPYIYEISSLMVKLDFITTQVCENIFWCFRILRRFCLTNNAICQPQWIATFCVSANWHIHCLFIGIYMTKWGVLCVCLYVAAVKWWGNLESIWNFGDSFMIIMGFAVQKGTRVCPTGRGPSPM